MPLNSISELMKADSKLGHHAKAYSPNAVLKPYDDTLFKCSLHSNAYDPTLTTLDGKTACSKPA